MSDVAVRNPRQEIVAQIRSQQFKEQVQLALPENVPPNRFVRATVTALMQNPDLAKAEPDSLFTSVIQCAQLGLLPDGREAAIVMFGRKATCMSMIGGLRKIAAEFGWTLRTQVVYEHDDFDYELGLDVTLKHKPVAIGGDRGRMSAAYCVATHRDGRREFEVMTASEIDKVRLVSRAKDSGPWKDWPERMWEKTVGRRMFAKLPLDPNDRRVATVLDASDMEPHEATAALYGPPRVVDRSTGEVLEDRSQRELESPHPGENDGANQAAVDQQAADSPASTPDGAAAAPGDEDEPAVGSPFVAPASAQMSLEQAGLAVVTRTEQKGRTLAELAELDKADEWLAWAIRRAESYWGSEFRTALEAFVAARFPEMWAALVEERDNR